MQCHEAVPAAATAVVGPERSVSQCRVCMKESRRPRVMPASTSPAEPAAGTVRVSPDSPPVAYVDAAGACLYTSMSRRTLDYAKSRGELPFIRKGRKVVFRVADLDRWMEQGRIDVSGAVRRMKHMAA